MLRPTTSNLLLGGLVLLSAGCDSKSSEPATQADQAQSEKSNEAEGVSKEAWRGIFEVTGFSRNEAGCDEEGNSVLADVEEKFVLGTTSDLIRGGGLVYYSCASLETCRDFAKKQAAGEYLQPEASWWMDKAGGAGLSGRVEEGGFTDKEAQLCKRPRLTKLSAQLDGETLRIESREFKGTDYPMGDDGCTPSRGAEAAEKGECETFEVITAERRAAL